MRRLVLALLCAALAGAPLASAFAAAQPCASMGAMPCECDSSGASGCASACNLASSGCVLAVPARPGAAVPGADPAERQEPAPFASLTGPPVLQPPR